MMKKYSPHFLVAVLGAIIVILGVVEAFDEVT